MAIYRVSDARHRVSGIALAVGEDAIIWYGCELLGTDSQGYSVISYDDLMDPSYEQYNVAFKDPNSENYWLITQAKTLARADMEKVDAGSSWVFAIEQGYPTLIDLPCEMYPNTDVGEWRYTKYKMIRPCVRIHFHTDNEDFRLTDRIYYCSNTNDTAFFTQDEIPSQSVYNDELPIHPQLTVQTLTNGDIHIHLEYANGSVPADGTIQFVNKSGLMVDYIPVVNGDGVISHQYITGIPFADVLFHYKKIGQLYA